MHGDVVLAGPVWWIAVAFLLAAWVLSAVTAFDSLRVARAERFAELPETPWVYFVPAVSYFVIVIITQLTRVPALAIGIIIAAPFLMLLGMVYLLRVAFPKQPHAK